MKFNVGIFDSHVHPSEENNPDLFVQSALDHLSASGLDGENILMMHLGGFTSVGDPLGLYLKLLHPDKFTVYGGLLIQTGGFSDDGPGLRAQLQALIDAGFDGLKIGAKSADLIIRGYGIDDARFDPMFDLLEETGFPVTYHVSDPEFWPAKRGPGVDQTLTMDPEPRAISGDTYATYFPRMASLFDPFEPRTAIPSQREGLTHEEKETLYEQLENLLNRHPKARVTFPHALFLSAELERLRDFLYRHPAICIDITPGYEQFYNYSRRVSDWRSFFIEFQDRIVFGTDNNFGNSPAREIDIIRHFFETNETFFVPAAHCSWGIDIHGIAPLPEEVLRKIYRDNFFHLCNPQKVDPAKALAYTEYVYSSVADRPEVRLEVKEGLLELIHRFRTM